MLQFNIRPATPATAITLGQPTAGPGPWMSDLLAHVKNRKDISGETRASYGRAINKLAEILNEGLGRLPADLDWFDERFPLKGFDTRWWKTNKAYGLWRRRVQAALRAFLGIHAEQAKLRAQQDQWSELFAAIQPLTAGRVGVSARWHPMKLEALKTFALVARKFGWQPRDLNVERAAQIDEAFKGNKCDANRRCLARLDDLRAFPEVLPHLPVQPIGYSPEYRRQVRKGLPSPWEDQLQGWVSAITTAGWDPVTETHSDEHKKHAHVMKSALRMFLGIATDLDLVSPTQTDLAPLMSNASAVTRIAGAMLARKDLPRKDGHLEPRTSRKYLKLLRQVREHLGHDNSELELILANNKIAREGKKAEDEMTPKNRRFCESVVEQMHLRRRFLGSFRTLRDAAQDILNGAVAEDRKLTKSEIIEARTLGACAAFCALEIGGAPVRIENAMLLTCVGTDAQIRIPKKGKKPIQVVIPKELTKNKVQIEFSIRSNKFGYFDTIRWYLEEIRPLFPHADSSRYLFPAVTTPGAPMSPSWFGAQFSTLMRTIVELPMTPHQFRHGQVSILLDKYPNEIAVIAKRIGDTLETVRKNYSWLNALKLVERGQDLLVGLIDA